MAEEQPEQQEDKEYIRNEEKGHDYEYEEEVEEMEEAQPNMVQEDLKLQ